MSSYKYWLSSKISNRYTHSLKVPVLVPKHILQAFQHLGVSFFPDALSHSAFQILMVLKS